MELRILHPEEDAALFEAAWEWQYEKPRWWREMYAVWTETREEFLEKRFSELILFIGIFEAGAFCGLISLEATADGVFEAHFDCPRETPVEMLADAIVAAREHCFERGAREIYSFVASCNRPLLKVCAACGFRRSGVSVLYGSLRGRVLEWQQLVLVKNPIA